MLSSIRKFSTSIYAKILLGIVVIPFVFWGMGSSFTAGNKNVVVIIDKEKFSTQEFANFVKSYQNVNEKLSSEKIDQLLSNFIGNKIIEIEYKNFNIKLTDNSLSKLIMIQNEFKRDNEFSRTDYEKFLITNNLDVVSFETSLAKEEKRKQLLNFIGGGIYPPKFIINKTFNGINQKREIELINLNDSFSKDLNFTNDQIKSYYNNNIKKYNEIFKSVKLIELTPKNLIETDEFNEIFFKKLDEIHDLVIQGNKLELIINDYNLPEANKYTINKVAQNKNFQTVNKTLDSLVSDIFLLEENEPTAFFEKEDKFFIVEVFKTENFQKNLTNEGVVKDIKINLEFNKKKELMSNIISKINQNIFKKEDFNKFSKNKNINIQKINIQNLSDNKILKQEIVDKIYSAEEKKIIIVHDLEFKENYLIYIDKIINKKLADNTKDSEKYFKLSKINIANDLFGTYDEYLKKKYEIDINHKALNTVKSYFN